MAVTPRIPGARGMYISAGSSSTWLPWRACLSPAVSERSPYRLERSDRACGDCLRRHRGHGPTARCRRRFPKRFLTLRFGTKPADLDSFDADDLGALLALPPSRPSTGPGLACRANGVTVAQSSPTRRYCLCFGGTMQLPHLIRSGRQAFCRIVSCTDCRISGTTREAGIRLLPIPFPGRPFPRSSFRQTLSRQPRTVG